MPHARDPAIFHGRRLGPLVSAWIGGAIVAAILFWVDKQQPAFHDIIVPLYGVIAIIVGFTTWKWARARHKDRREHERRRADRGHQQPPNST